ncbi:LysR family transcriptional regulator [Verticiella sediminum]|uniref:LysR family transcriptional regulator n=1 Tax=Verticiella sediminum TaxID=1247510 RepID=A0A556APM3_9BURK|nr:LysR family transcriptional regulator [Verticiella sediminum]TSH94820.1 LysR family transcriptional regulator [Verticiella sediminum]
MNLKFAESLEVFVDVFRARSFSEVARRRGLVASSVARQVDALEGELGVSLFTRSTRALAPTEAGERLFERAVRILHDLREARSEVTAIEQGVHGLLRLSCLPAFARRHVLPWLGDFNDRYPGIRIELDLTERIVDPVVERVDLVLRVGQQPDSSLVGQRLGTHRYLMCAAPAYLARHGEPTCLAELDGHRLIDRRHSTSMRGWRELIGTPRAACAPSFVLECDDCDARRLAVIQGLGIALMPNWSVGAEVASGTLREIALSDVAPLPPSGIYALRALPRASARIRAFTDYLAAKLAAYEAASEPLGAASAPAYALS